MIGRSTIIHKIIAGRIDWGKLLIDQHQTVVILATVYLALVHSGFSNFGVKSSSVCEVSSLLSYEALIDDVALPAACDVGELCLLRILSYAIVFIIEVLIQIALNIVKV